MHSLKIGEKFVFLWKNGSILIKEVGIEKGRDEGRQGEGGRERGRQREGEAEREEER